MLFRGSGLYARLLLRRWLRWRYAVTRLRLLPAQHLQNLLRRLGASVGLVGILLRLRFLLRIRAIYVRLTRLSGLRLLFLVRAIVGGFIIATVVRFRLSGLGLAKLRVERLRMGRHHHPGSWRGLRSVCGGSLCLSSGRCL